MQLFSISVVPADQPHSFAYAKGIKTIAGAKTRAGGMVHRPGMKAAVAIYDPETQSHTPVAEKVYITPGKPWRDLLNEHAA